MPTVTERIRVSGTVQGVGFRPTVWRLANEHGVAGSVRNDARGVLIEAWGESESVERMVRQIRAEQPPLAIIEDIVREPLAGEGEPPADFVIEQSAAGETATNVAADAATCEDCQDDIRDPSNRRYRYPFTNCTHCGPRLSITRTVPYDRCNTSMAEFEMCPRCRAEYENPADRRFHAQPNACPDCGPTVWLEDAAGERVPVAEGDAISAAADLLRQGRIVAVKGLGGFHLACLATDAGAVDALRARKRRYQKALAMMARDVETIRRYADVDEHGEAALRSRQAPIVLLPASGRALPQGVAPGQDRLGFMLPYTPLHHLLLESFEDPVVMTSGNRSDEPQVIDNDSAREQLGDIADVFLMHDRDIVNRLDDSVVQALPAESTMLRRARGFAPEPIDLHPSFASSLSVLALGGELKNTFCLLRGNRALVSQHMGDMEDANALTDYLANLELYESLYDFYPQQIAVDRHPEYVPTKLTAQQFPEIPRTAVQHHHAHVAACMAEHGLSADSPPVLGIVLDGLGMGDDDTFWGGEFFAADFSQYTRVGRFLPVAMPGGTRAIREPWRNAWAHLHAAFGWDLAKHRYGDADAIRYLADKPVATLQQMQERGVNSPLGSSAGRLFDAVAALLGICADGIAHEAQAAMELEALATRAEAEESANGYPCERLEDEVPTLAWRPMWQALLEDLQAGVESERIAARFHIGLATAVADLATDLARERSLPTVALSGGVFQNALLLRQVRLKLESAGLEVLAHTRLPANDGGISLGQAVVTACRNLSTQTH